MREIIARAVCLLTIGVVVALSYRFALAQNPRPAAGAVPVPAATGGTDRGRAVYAEQHCATCHAIAGEGNPRQSLDGVGARWEPKELRAWITGTGIAADMLPAAIAKVKQQRYEKLPEADLTALVAYLAGLKPSQ